MSGAIRIGCSGWQYRHWRGDFYPADLPVDRWLDFYVRHFDTVELNNSFYRLPTAGAFAAWGRRTPMGFRFAVKASRYLTHIRKLNEPDQPLDLLWSRARQLGAHLGPMLYQLPPRWHRNRERLAAFLAAIPHESQAIEFRDSSWYDPAVLELLRSHEVGLCLHDMRGSETPLEPVGPLVYVRLHGADSTYGGRYPDEALAGWAERLATWASSGRDCWVYFNNDLGGHAPRDALRLRGLLQQRAAPVGEPAYSAKNPSSP
jgi:uncharacterized protein YecE (DUF72 family)